MTASGLSPRASAVFVGRTWQGLETTVTRAFLTPAAQCTSRKRADFGEGTEGKPKRSMNGRRPPTMRSSSSGIYDSVYRFAAEWFQRADTSSAGGARGPFDAYCAARYCARGQLHACAVAASVGAQFSARIDATRKNGHGSPTSTPSTGDGKGTRATGVVLFNRRAARRSGRTVTPMDSSLHTSQGPRPPRAEDRLHCLRVDETRGVFHAAKCTQWPPLARKHRRVTAVFMFLSARNPAVWEGVCSTERVRLSLLVLMSEID